MRGEEKEKNKGRMRCKRENDGVSSSGTERRKMIKEFKAGDSAKGMKLFRL